MDLERLTNIYKTLYKRTHIPIQIFDGAANPLFQKTTFTELLRPFLDRQIPNGAKMVLTNNYKFLHATFPYRFAGQQFYILIGPTLVLGDMSESIIEFHGKRLLLTKYLATESEKEFLEFVQMIYQLTMDASLTEKDISISHIAADPQQTQPKKLWKDFLFDRRSQEATRDSYQFELRFIDYIKRNKRDKIEWLFKKASDTYVVHLSVNDLEGLRLKFSSLVTLVTRTAIDCGVPLDSAFSLSDSLIRGLDYIRTPAECASYMHYATFEFMDLIHGQPYANYSGFINQTISYIDAHLYEKITLQELAIVTNRTPAYLSHQFKQEVGETIKHYILARKTEEAKELLLFTDHSYQEISTLLCFASQSHFTQHFKKATTLTPKQFRMQHFQYL